MLLHAHKELRKTSPGTDKTGKAGLLCEYRNYRATLELVEPKARFYYTRRANISWRSRETYRLQHVVFICAFLSIDLREPPTNIGAGIVYTTRINS